MEEFKSKESCKPYFEDSYGYAIFPTIAKIGIAFVGGAGGKGDVYVNNDDGIADKVGTSKMFQASIGPQFGGQVYRMIIFFQREKDYKKFTEANFEFGADANAVALTASAGATVSSFDNNVAVKAGVDKTNHSFEKTMNTLMFTNGMAVFTSTTGGLMYEASLSGQKYTYKFLENESVK